MWGCGCLGLGSIATQLSFFKVPDLLSLVDRTKNSTVIKDILSTKHTPSVLAVYYYR